MLASKSGLKGVLRYSSRHPKLLLLFLLAVTGLFYISVWSDAPVISSDSGTYMRFATDLQDLSIDKPQNRPPGYPVLLWLTNSAEEPTRLLFVTQLLLHLAAVFFVVRYLNYVTTPKPIVVLFMFLGLIPPSVVMTAYVMSESLTEFLLVAGTVLLLLGLGKEKLSLVVISSLVLSLSGTVRPGYQLVSVPLLGIALVCFVVVPRSSKLLALAAVSTFLFSAVLTGGFRNDQNKHFFVFGLSTRTARFLEMLPDKYAAVRGTLIKYRDRERVAAPTADERTERPWHTRIHNGLYYLWSSRSELKRITGFDDEQLTHYLLRLNIDLIRIAPLLYLEEVAAGVPTYWFPLSTQLSDFESDTVRFAWALIQFIVTLLFFFLVPILLAYVLLLATSSALRKKRASFFASGDGGLLAIGFLVTVGMVMYTMIPAIAVNVGNPRHRAPTELLIFLAIALGMHFLIQMRKSLTAGACPDGAGADVGRAAKVDAQERATARSPRA